jgi:hypothetical protein
VDSGLRNHLLSAANADVGHQAENIVYLELLRRGYRANIGKLDGKEIDFVAAKQNTKKYYQTALTALDERVQEHELDPLRRVGDNYPKYRLTLDFISGDYEGIKQVNLIDCSWLNKPSCFILLYLSASCRQTVFCLQFFAKTAEKGRPEQEYVRLKDEIREVEIVRKAAERIARQLDPQERTRTRGLEI